MWDFSVIKDLLMNPVYTGAIASQKKDYRFKIGTIGEKKPEDWIVVEGQHEPLIDRMSFDIVQNKLKSRQRPGQTNEKMCIRDRDSTRQLMEKVFAENSTAKEGAE